MDHRIRFAGNHSIPVERRSSNLSSSARFATGFRNVGIRKIVTFLGLSQTFGSVVSSGFFGFAIVVFSDDRRLMNVRQLNREH
jgi:hypothetical protein